MSVFSLVAARKNSKGLKDKVVRKINGRYIFDYSVQYSLSLATKINAEIITVVSSDSEIIEEYCIKNSLLFVKRKSELASDTATIEDVIYDAYINVGRESKYISLLYGNIPIRYPEEFIKAFNFLEDNHDYDAVLSMQNVQKYNPAWMFKLNEDFLCAKDEVGYRRQDLEPFMIHDGHTILTRTKHFIEFMKQHKSCGNIMYEAFGKKVKPMLSDKAVVDIDTEKDLVIAEAILKSSH